VSKDDDYYRALRSRIDSIDHKLNYIGEIVCFVLALFIVWIALEIASPLEPYLLSLAKQSRFGDIMYIAIILGVLFGLSKAWEALRREWYRKDYPSD
jgi:membrane protease YdiL (CAAX protease family)